MTEANTIRDSSVKKDIADKNYMPALTGVRAIAAYMVCFHHFNPIPSSFKAEGGWKLLLYGVFNEMYIGVSLFFVLSGFLICYRYYESGIALNKQWFGRYLLSRVARVYPMFFLTTLLAFLFIELNPARYEVYPFGMASRTMAEQVAVVLLNVTMLKGFFEEYIYTGVSQSWSLTVEECFYVSVPFFMLLVRRSRWALLVLPAILLLAMVGLVITIGKSGFHGLFTNLEFALNFTFLGRCVEFFVGMALALFVLRQQKRNAEVAGTRRGWFTLAGSLAVIGCLVAMAALAAKENVGFAKDAFAGIAFNNVLLPFAVAVLFYGLIAERTWVSKVLSTSFFDLLGKSSYVFYLIHVGVISVLIKVYIIHNSIIQFVLLNVLAVLLYKFVESPLHSWFKPKPAAAARTIAEPSQILA